MDHVRHSALFNVSSQSVTLIGCGGIGAITALTLAKMGVGFLNLYDGDVVDEVNLATQLHKLSDVGRPKVEALAEMLVDFADDTRLDPAFLRVDPDYALQDQFVISAVDSIRARKDIWQAVKSGQVRWYFDARMAAEEFHLYVVDMKSDTSWYDQIISGEDDSLVPEIACTAKATFYTAAVASGLIGSALKTVSIGEAQPRITILNIRGLALTVIS